MGVKISFLAIIAIGLPNRELPAAPRPERIGVTAIHPACTADGDGAAARTTVRFCGLVARRLIDRGYRDVTVVAGNDPALGAPRHLVLGFRLADDRIGPIDVVTITGRIGRADLAGGTLYPPAARIVPVIDRQPTDATLMTAADSLVRDMGL